MKKGFTLVELITVIVLLSLIALFTYPVVTRTIKDRKEDLYKIQVQNIKEASLSYINKNSLLKDDPVIVTVCQLKQNGFLDEDIKDPRDGSFIPDDSKVTVIPGDDGNEYIFVLGENKSNYCGVGSTTLFEYVEAGSTYTETIPNIGNYKIYVNNSSDAFVGSNYVDTTSLGTYFIEYKSNVKTIQKYIYIVDTTAPTITYKNNVNGSREIGKSLITLEASSDVFVPYETVARDNASGNVTVKINSSVNGKIPGTYIITYSATDESGNTTIKTQNIKVQDTISPVVNVSGVDGNKTPMSIVISVDASDDGSGLHPSGAYSFDGGETWQTTSTITIDNNQTLNIVVRDLAGNKTNKKVVVDRILKDDNNISFTVVSGTIKNNGWYVSDVKVKIKPLLSSSYFSSFSYCKTTSNRCAPDTLVNNYDGVDIVLSENTENTVICAFVNRKDGSKTETVCSTNFRIDKSVPITNYDFVSGSQNAGYEPWYVSNVKLKVVTDSLSGIDTIKYCTTTKTSCTPNKNLSGTTVSLSSQSKNNNVCAYITNKAGTSGSTVCSIKYSIDKNKPSVTISATNGSGNTVSDNGYVRDKVTLKANVTPSATNISGYTYVWYKDGAIIQESASDTLVVNNPDNTYRTDNYSVVVITGAGNKSNEDKITLKVDTVKPTCTIAVINETSARGENGWYKAKPTLQITPSDGQSGVDTYDITTSSNASYNNNRTTSLDTGKYNVYGYVKDNVGNAGTCNYTEEVNVDTVTPSCSVVYKSGYSSAWAQRKEFLLTNISKNISGVTVSMTTNHKSSYVPSGSFVYYPTRNDKEATQYGYLPYAITGRVTSGSGLTGTCSMQDSTTDSVKISAVLNSNGYVDDTWSYSDVILTCGHNNIEGVEPRSGVKYYFKNESGTIVAEGSEYKVTTSGSYTCYAVTGATLSSEAGIKVKLDKTKPDVSITGKKVSGSVITSGSWSNENVILTGSINPSTTLSGYTYAWYKGSTKVGSSTTYTATTNGTYKFVVTTGAGATSEATFVVNIDKTAPTCSLTLSGTKGSDNWYSSDVKVTGTFNDTGGSGVDGKNVTNSSSVSYSGNTSYTVSSNTSGTAIYCYVKDKAGNTGKNSITVKRDAGSASCSLNNQNTTWTNVDPYTYYELTTSYSGIASLDDNMYCSNTGSGPSGGSYSCMAGAADAISSSKVIKTYTFPSMSATLVSGASVSCPEKTANVYYDGEAPVCTYSNNYNATSNGDVTLTIGCDDKSGSGCKVGTGTSKKITSTVKGRLTTTIEDNAGNTTECSKAYEITVDKTPPTCTYTGDYSAVSNKSVTIKIGCSDIGSGCTSDSVNSKVITSSGKGTLSKTIKDKAGNSTVCSKAYDITIDKTPPTCTYSGDYNAVTNKSVTIEIGCSDSGSGCTSDSLNKKVITSSGKGTLTTTIKDKVGNSTVCSKAYDVVIDKVKPTCSLTPSGTKGSNGWFTSDVKVNGTFNDTGGSGLNGKDVTTSSSALYNGSVSTTISSNTSGTTVYCHVKDKAGNVGQNSITVKKDSRGGSCSLKNENTTWTNVDPYTYYELTTSSYAGIASLDDNMYCSNIGSGSSGGSYSCMAGAANVISSSKVIKTYTFPSMNATLGTGASVSCPSKTANVYYDSEAPVCTYSNNYNATSNGDVTLTIGCDDKSGSGCKVGTGTSKKITSTVKGRLTTTIEDNAGNTTECSKAYEITVDKTAPTCTYTGDYSAVSNKSVTIKIGCSDIGSGCTSDSVNSKVITSSGKGTLSKTIKDKAGNSTVCSKAYDITIDKTPPTCTYTGDYNAVTNSGVALTIGCSDAGSGCIGATPEIKIISSSGKGTFRTTIYDYAGNSTVCSKAYDITIDKTAPTCSISTTTNNSTSGISGKVTVTDTGGSGLSTNSSYTFTNRKSSFSYTMTDNAGNSATCSINVSSKKQTRNSNCKTFKTCVNSACGSNYTAWSGTTCYGTPGTCQGRITNNNLQRCTTVTTTGCPGGSTFQTRKWSSYKSCTTESCGCLTWGTATLWVDTSSCSASTTYTKKIECRTIYYKS